MKLNNPFNPPPAPPSFGSGKVLPEGNAPLLSRLIFQWLGPFLSVGFSRPLQKDDLWELPYARLTGTITDAVEANFFSRCEPDKRPRHLRDKLGDLSASANFSPSSTKEEDDAISIANSEKVDPSPILPKWYRSWFRRTKTPGTPKYDASLAKTLHNTFFFQIWTAGSLKLFSDTLKTTTPLLTKVILTWLTNSYIYYRLSDAQRASSGIAQPQGIGYGIGLAIGLFAMQDTKVS